MKKLIILFFPAFLLILFLYSNACDIASKVQMGTTIEATTQPAQTTASTTTTVAKPAVFSVTDLTVFPSTVEAGAEEFSIYVKVANTGDIQGTYEVVVDTEWMGQLTQTINVDAGNSEVASFTLLSPSEGMYYIRIDGLSEILIAT